MPNLIFDFDGVLADTYEVTKGTQTKMNVGNSEAFIDFDEYIIKKPNHTKNHTLTTEEMKKLVSRVNEFGTFVHQSGFVLFDDFVQEIKKLKVTNQAVVSSGSQIYILPALAKSGLELTHVLAFEDHHSKEEKIELICRDWGIEVSETYYFTDTLADVYELQNFIHPDKLIGVAWGYCSKEQLLTELKPENILNSPADLPKLLAR
ncbi:MAG: HAD hydrolase-like protein [Candidatus Paceibacterota bacterium]